MDFKSLRIAFALLLPLLWVDGVWATPCADTYYELTTQAEVDALGQTGCISVSDIVYFRFAGHYRSDVLRRFVYVLGRW